MSPLQTGALHARSHNIVLSFHAGIRRPLTRACFLASVVALTVSASASAKPAASSPIAPAKFLAQLTPSQEAPHQTVKNTNASGSFSATVTTTKTSYKISWQISFKGLTGPATSLYIHEGKPGAYGPALVHLCSPCKSGASGSDSFSKPYLVLARGGGVYVNLRTAKNPAGEIRGQLKLS